MRRDEAEAFMENFTDEVKSVFRDRGLNYAPNDDALENIKKTYAVLKILGLTELRSPADVIRFFVVTKIVRESLRSNAGKGCDLVAQDSRLDVVVYTIMLSMLETESEITGG